jgi:hypothetical protein
VGLREKPVKKVLQSFLTSMITELFNKSNICKKRDTNRNYNLTYSINRKSIKKIEEE